jgi:SAM-dependent methyltransferase
MNDYEVIDGFRCYAPALAKQNDGFPAESFSRLYELEKANFWFRARNKLIQQLVSKYLAGGGDVCEIGCGTGYVLEGLQSMPGVKLSGSEIYVQGLRYAKERLPGVDLFQADATQLPFRERFDAIGAFDVLEHIEEDTSAMKSIYGALRPGGFFFITVPQYAWMWSVQDDYALHKRRYTRKELVTKLRESGFTIQYAGSFVFTLFPMMAISRFFKKENNEDILSEFKIPRILNSLFYKLMLVDCALIRMGISLPWGGSLVCVASK